MSIFVLLDEKPDVLPVGSGGERSGGAKGSLWSSALELRASGTVGLRWQAVFGSSDRLEIDRLDAPGHAARRGMAGPDG